MEENNNIKAAGCFPAGTKINTPTGYRLIEDIREGDEVYAFSLKNRFPGMEDEQPGLVYVKKVTEVFRHYVGEVGETTKLLKISYHGEPEHGIIHDDVLTVTGNHYILTPSKQSDETDPGFARADQLEVGDVMWTEYGDEVIITNIEDGGEYDFVYNFEVEDLHTYIAGGIRVHNGGGGKGKSRAPKQSPNSIQVKQTIRVLLSPGEGEIGGLWNDDIAQSVFFDGTPLKNADGTYNFVNVGVDERTGLPDQSVIPGFSAVEAETIVGQPLTAAVPYTRVVSSANIDAVRVTVEFTSGLQKIDTGNGDANGTSVSFQIQRRIQGGTWETVASPTIKEMSSGPFTVAGLLPRPAATGVWEWRISRTTPDTNLNNIIDKTSVDSFTEIQDVKLQYNNRALVAIAVGADSTNGRVPAIALDLKGKLVKVPSNYNPTTRAYTGAWDGTFSPTLQWTDNPAWVIYDLCQHERYGLAAYGFNPSRLDVYSFYEAAKYCDELVPTAVGSGKFEPRFTFNAQLMVRESAFHTLNTIASTMNAKLYEHNGYVRIAQDRPAVPGRLITNSNVLDGLFVYSTSSAEETYTQVNVTYSNPDSNFLPTTVSEVASTADRARFKHNSVDLAAYGATSEGQARRAAKWVLDTSLRQTELVNFSVSLENAWFEPNEIFYLMDKDYSQTTQEGRLLSKSGTTLVLDKAINTGTGTWTIALYSADGATIEERTITSTNNSASVTVNSTVTAEAGTVYIITGAIKPRQFRLVSMTDGDNGTYNVQAVQHDPNKYARVEQGIIVPDEVYWQAPQLDSTDTPTNLQVDPQTAINADGQVYRYLNISWTPPGDGTAVSYQFQWRRNGQPLTTEFPPNAFAIVQADFSGEYEFFVNAFNAAGTMSPTLSGTYTFEFEGIDTGGTASEIGPVTNLQLSGGGTTFSGSMPVVWNPPAVTSTKVQIKDYEVSVKTAGGTVLRTFFVTDTGFVYSYDDNVADGGPRSSLLVTVRVRDTLNRFSTAVGQTFSSVAAAGITNLQVRGGGTTFNTLDLEVTWDATTNGVNWRTDPNFAYFKVDVLSGTTVKRSANVTDAAFTYTFNDNVKDNGQDTPLNPIGIRVTAYSKLDVAGVSASGTFTAGNPPAVTSLFVKGRTDTIFNESDLNAVWACLNGTTAYSASNVFKHFKVEVLNGATVKRTDKVFSEAYSYTLDQNTQDNTNPIRNPILRVTAVSVYNTNSTPTAATFTNPPPAIPGNLQVTSGIGNYKVSFDNHVDYDVEGTFVWQSTTAGFTPSASNLIATMAGGQNYISINGAQGTKYYVRVAAFDTFGKGAKDGAGLNISAESSATTEAAGILKSATAPTSPPPVKGDVYINTTDNKMYRYTGTAWTAAVPAADLTGTLTNDQIAAIDATKVTGQLTNAQIAAIAATKVTGQITGTQIADDSITSAKIVAGSIVAGDIAAGTITGNEIAAATITGTKIAGNTITASNITSGTITATQIAGGTITGDRIAADTINAGNIAANAITATELATDSVTAIKILASAVSTDKLAANAVVADKIAANAIITDKINAGAITGDKIAANTITANKIDTRGLDIKDANGNVIFSSGVNLAAARITPAAGWLNSNVTPASISAVATNLSNAPAGILNSNITAASIGALSNTFSINANNASTYIASAAIGTLYLANGAVTDIKTGNARATTPTIEIGGRAPNTEYQWVDIGPEWTVVSPAGFSSTTTFPMNVLITYQLVKLDLPGLRAVIRSRVILQKYVSGSWQEATWIFGAGYVSDAGILYNELSDQPAETAFINYNAKPGERFRVGIEQKVFQQKMNNPTTGYTSGYWWFNDITTIAITSLR